MQKNGCVLSVGGRRYEIIETLGRGANTIAYLAQCEHDGLVTKCILKEYAPQNTYDPESGKARFIASGKAQNSIRQLSMLNNQTPPVSHIFEANGTAYIDVACYNGTTLDKLDSLTLPQYMQICMTVAKTVGYYHKSGYLCLDLKPENIFVMQNAPDDTITQLVEFIDFDSIRDVNNSGSTVFSYTREWAAPEQLNPYAAANIGFSADIYTLGEMVFYLLFGRHSTESEHRGFSKYPFDECRREYRKFVLRPDIQALYMRIFRGTIRSSVSNRFKNISEAEMMLGELVSLLEQKDYVIPTLPSVSPDFVGRDTEMKQIAESLQRNPVLFITGVGGIGKSTLVKNYISRYKTDYDVIAYLEYDGDIQHTFCDDMQLRISSISMQDGEPVSDYFIRKLTHFMQICGDKRVLFILDNFSGRVTKELSRIIDCGYDTIIVTRNRPPKNSFAFMEIGAIADAANIFRLIALDLERSPTKEERLCFDEIITLVQGHTLVIELIARQIAAGRLDVHTALQLIRENGFSRFSEAKVGNYKDGEEVYDTLSVIISELFNAAGLGEEEWLTMKVLSLLDVRGLEKNLVQKFFPEIPTDTISALYAQGWLYVDKNIRVHPVIAETVQGWKWNADDVSVMDYHKKMTDIYVGMTNAVHIREILREAEDYKNNHPRHIITGMYYDILGCYYDTLLNGAYTSENRQEAELAEKLTDVMYTAIEEMSLSSDGRKTKYLTKYYLSLAAILIRCYSDCNDEAAELLDRAYKIINADESEVSENNCYYCMVSAWYSTIAEHDVARTKALTQKAEIIAKQVFPTDLEIIDIIHIPAANCYYYNEDFRSAATTLEQAVLICEKYPDSFPYIDKKAELMNCLIDVYRQLQDYDKCRRLIAGIDRINEKFKDEGVFREVPSEIRNAVKAGS